MKVNIAIDCSDCVGAFLTSSPLQSCSNCGAFMSSVVMWKQHGRHKDVMFFLAGGQRCHLKEKPSASAPDHVEFTCSHRVCGIQNTWFSGTKRLEADLSGSLIKWTHPEKKLDRQNIVLHTW